jgi:hypothetical protein
LYWHDKSNKSTKEGTLSVVLFESPFTSVSTVGRGHPSLVSLIVLFKELHSMAYVMGFPASDDFFKSASSVTFQPFTKNTNKSLNTNVEKK